MTTHLLLTAYLVVGVFICVRSGIELSQKRRFGIWKLPLVSFLSLMWPLLIIVVLFYPDLPEE